MPHEPFSRSNVSKSFKNRWKKLLHNFFYDSGDLVKINCDINICSSEILTSSWYVQKWIFLKVCFGTHALVQEPFIFTFNQRERLVRVLHSVCLCALEIQRALRLFIYEAYAANWLLSRIQLVFRIRWRECSNKIYSFRRHFYRCNHKYFYAAVLYCSK